MAGSPLAAAPVSFLRSCESKKEMESDEAEASGKDVGVAMGNGFVVWAEMLERCLL